MEHAVFRTGAGWIALAQTERGVRRLTLPCASEAEAVAQLAPDLARGSTPDPRALEWLARRVERTFAGEEIDLSDISLDLAGRTAFQAAVLNSVRTIPRGSVRSYGQVAAAAGRPRAARAVGAVMASNPVCLIVPCHRVVGADGSLVGFGGGIDMKRRLLAMEGARL